MDKKKLYKAEIESKKNIILLFSIAASILLVLMVMEWSEKKEETDLYSENRYVSVDFDVELLLPVNEDIVKPPLPHELPTNLNIVDDKKKVNTNITLDFGADEKTLIKYKNSENNAGIMLYAEQMPEFPGGYEELNRYIIQNLDVPEAKPERNQIGKVYVRFAVTEKGKITNVSVLQGINPDYDEAAIELIRKMPLWKPAIHNGDSVRVWMTIPVVFR